MARNDHDRAVNLLGALSLAVADHMGRAVAEAAGARSAAPAALVALDGFLDGGSMDHLRRVVGLTSSGAVRLVDRLQSDGYVERRPGIDGRSVALRLTARGREAAGEVRHARADAVGRVLSTLSDDERRTLTLLLERMLGEVTLQRLADRTVGDGPADGWLCRLCDLAACGRDAGTCPAANAAAATAAS
jgi:MarR family transcriptional repressor of emrRAB